MGTTVPAGRPGVLLRRRRIQDPAGGSPTTAPQAAPEAFDDAEDFAAHTLFRRQPQLEFIGGHLEA